MDYLVLSEDGFSAVEPYVPIVYADRSPSGSVAGSTSGSINVLTNRYRVAFSGDGSSTVYTMPAGYSVAADAVTVTVNGVEMKENNGFSFNRTNQKATFSAAPSAGTNNVVFTLTGTDAAQSADLLACRHAIVYAGDSRVMLGGTGRIRSTIRSSTSPPISRRKTGSMWGDDEDITGFGRQYDLLAVFKAHEIATVSYSYSAGTTKLTANILSPVVGCDMPGSICNIDNRIVFANTQQGVSVITSTSRENEHNVLTVSRNVNPRLLAEPRERLTEASACCFEGRYWLSVGGHVYLWDNVARPVRNSTDEDALRGLSWYYFDNIPAVAWFSHENTLYYARREAAGEENGVVVQFVRQFNDFGQAIAAHWRSAALDFGRPNWYKTLERIWFVCRGAVSSDTAVRYLFDEKKSDVSLSEPVNLKVSSFSWRLFNWSKFSWDVPGYFRTFSRRPLRRRVLFFSIELESADVSRDLSLADIVVQYRFDYKLK